MNTCRCNRESVALLACSALSPAEAERIREHLQQCPACREYLQQMSALAEAHVAASGQLPCAEAPPRLYRRVVAAIRPGSGGGRGDAPGWRWIQLAGSVVFLLLLAWGLVSLRPPPSPTPIAAEPVLAPLPKAATERPGSTLISYRLALNRSAEDLDRLLAQDAARPGTGPAMVFRPGPMRPDSALY